MNLAWHHFRKDVRQFRLHLAIWFALLLLDLAVNLDWVGRVVYSSPRGFDRAANTWTSILPGVLWLLIGLLPSLLILADSPARRDGFLATRPLPKRDLFVSKLFFVLALIVAPWVLQEFVHLLALGAPGWVVERGTLERVLFTVPVALACASFAALWPGVTRWARAVGILFGVVVLCSLSVSFLIYYFHVTFLESEPVKSKGVFQAYAVMLALVALAVWHSRGPRGAWERWGGLALAVVLAGWAATLMPWNLFQLQPTQPALATSTVAQSLFQVPLRNVTVARDNDAEYSGQDRCSVAIQIKAESPPLAQTIEWSGKDAQLLRVSGSAIPGQPARFFNELFRANTWNNNFNDADYAAWDPSFPGNVLFHQSQNYYAPSRAEISLGTFDLPADHAVWNQPLHLTAGLRASVFQWRKIADFPLQPGAGSTDEFGSWKFIATKEDKPVKALGTIYLERRQITLATAPDSRCSSAYGGPLARMAFLVYDAKHNVGWMPDITSTDDTDRGSQTALGRYYAYLQFYNSGDSFRPSETGNYRLVIFEKTWLGSVTNSWQSKPFTLEDKLFHAVPTLGRAGSMPEVEFRQRLAALSAPPAAAPRAEVARYLLEAARLVEARGPFPYKINDALVAQLAKYVPTHLDLLLDGLPAMDSMTTGLVVDAITRGATPEQKTAIIAALPRDPQLASVVTQRGWIQDARPQFYQFLQSDEPVPLPVLAELASFKDPQTYPRLLEEFDGQAWALDTVLRSLPGMEPQVGASVARQWQTAGLVWRFQGNEMFDWPLRLALSHGNRDALRRVYQVLNDPDFRSLGDGTRLPRSLAATVEMPGLKPEDKRVNSKVLAWMRQRRPDDFIFDPARRKFAPKNP